MIALISPAKSMRNSGGLTTSYTTTPRFEGVTNNIISLMLRYSAHELSDIFKISPSIAKELRSRFLEFHSDESQGRAAIECYNGVVYKHISGDRKEISTRERNYLQKSLRISSLLYGLLRPLDLIKPYRMEGFVRLAGSDERVDRHWREIQTQTLIDDVREAGGTLLYLASKEEQNAFHWSEVKRSVRVIDFKFLQPKGDKLRQVVIYTKMARGEMVRYMMQNNITDIEELKSFEWSGYRYNAELSTDDVWVWLIEL